MKRQERLKRRRRRRVETAARVTLAVVLIAGLVVGIMNLDAIKIWASKRYFDLRWRTIPTEGPDSPYPEIAGWAGPSEHLNLLFLGVDKGSIPDEEDTMFRSDVMILASLDVEEKKAVLVSIPRDTKVTIPGYGTQKINAAHSFNGPQAAMAVVKDLSGLEIHGYAEVDFAAFKNIVDAIGGVPFRLEHDILDPNVGALGKGDRVLNGEEALIVVRSRALPRGDMDRIENQKAFLKALMEKAVGVRDIHALLAILDAAVQYMDTTLEPAMIFTLAEHLQGMSVDGVEFVTLPGGTPDPVPGQPWYYVYDEEATARLFDNIERYSSSMTPEEQAAAQAQHEQRAAEAEAATEVDRAAVDLAVLNGVRWEGMAAQVAGRLEGKGYPDVATGNTVNTYDSTTIYYATGHEEEARAVAVDLDPDAAYVIREDNDVALTYGAQVILVIGQDYVSY